LGALSSSSSSGRRAENPKMSGLIPKHTVLEQLLACVAYGGVSISITLFNKAVFSIYHFKYPNLVMLGQMLVTLTLIKVASAYEIFEVSRISRSGLRKVRSRRARPRDPRRKKATPLVTD